MTHTYHALKKIRRRFFAGEISRQELESETGKALSRKRYPRKTEAKDEPRRQHKKAVGH